MPEAVAKFHLIGLQTEVSSMTDMEMVLFFTNKGVPQEIITRLQSLWNETKKITGKVFNVGKIIISKIIEFIQENPNLLIGIAIAVSITIIVSMTPFLGIILAPLVSVNKLALQGSKKDTGKSDEISHILEMAKRFWKLISDIFLAVKKYWSEN